MINPPLTPEPIDDRGGFSDDFDDGFDKGESMESERSVVTAPPFSLDTQRAGFDQGRWDQARWDADVGGATATTAVGRAISLNGNSITVQIAVLVDLLSLKIDELKIDHGQLNSDDSRAIVLKQIEQCEDMKSRVIALSTASSDYASGKAHETSVVETSTSFVRGVKNWWHHNHVAICDRTFDRATFFSAVAICDLIGAGGVLSVTAAATLIAGKPFADALGSAVKSLKEK